MRDRLGGSFIDVDQEDPQLDQLAEAIQAVLDAWHGGDSATATVRVDHALVLATEWGDPEAAEVARRLEQIRQWIESGINPDDFRVVDDLIP